jgi:hypothetical protein
MVPLWNCALAVQLASSAVTSAAKKRDRARPFNMEYISLSFALGD